MSNIRREVTAAEAADLLGVDRRTVVRYIEHGDLVPSQKLPGRTGAFLIEREAVEQLRDEREAATAR
jgi:excisionase family DNA binding protein